MTRRRYVMIVRSAGIQAAAAAVMIGVITVAGECGQAGRGDATMNYEYVVAEGNNSFAADVYRKLAEGKGNLFFSPFSIRTALSMTYAGAAGATAEQCARTLYVTLGPATGVKLPPGNRKLSVIPSEKYHAATAKLIGSIERGSGTSYDMTVANALWAQKGHPFLKEYTSLTRKHYDANLYQADFRTKAEPTRLEINAWVEKETRKKIKDLIPKGALGPATRLVLANAVYFKGKWTSEFGKKQTKDDSFIVAPGRTVTVPMMSQKDSFPYADREGIQVLELPYRGDELSMVVLLPREKDGLPALEASLTGAKLRGLLSRLGRREIKVYLPRFKLESQFGLSHTLSALGMKDAFEPGKADFSGMDGGKDLFISAVLHKAFVDVNEEGTEAAAATGVVVGITAMPAPPIVFRADHPFIFLIRHRRSGAILFLGRMSNPKG